MVRVIEAEAIIRARDATGAAFASAAAKAKGLSRAMQMVGASGAMMGRGATSALAQFGRVDAAMSASAMRFARTGAMLGGAAIVGGFVAATKASMDFESTLTGIQKKLGASDDAMQPIKRDILALATSGELAGASIDDIAAGYERAAAAGIPLDQMKEFVLLSTKAADAFEMDPEETANAILTIGKQLDIPIENSARLLDLINALGDAGQADERDIADFMVRAGANLKLMGFTADQSAALGTTLLNLGMQSEVGARAMNTMAIQLAATKDLSPKASQGLRRIVGDTDKFAEIMKDNPQEGFNLFLDNLNKMESDEALGAMKGLFGQGFSDEMMRLALGMAEYRKNQALAANESSWFGSVDKSYALKLDDMAAKWNDIKNEIAKAAIHLGDMGAPAVAAIFENLNAMFERWDAEGSPIERMMGSLRAFGEGFAAIKETLSFGGDEAADPLSAQFSRWEERGRAVATVLRDIRQGYLLMMRAYVSVQGFLDTELTLGPNGLPQFVPSPERQAQLADLDRELAEIEAAETADEARAKIRAPAGPAGRKEIDTIGDFRRLLPAVERDLQSYGLSPGRAEQIAPSELAKLYGASAAEVQALGEAAGAAAKQLQMLNTDFETVDRFAVTPGNIDSLLEDAAAARARRQFNESLPASPPPMSSAIGGPPSGINAWGGSRGLEGLTAEVVEPISAEVSGQIDVGNDLNIHFDTNFFRVFLRQEIRQVIGDVMISGGGSGPGSTGRTLPEASPARSSFGRATL